MQSSFFFLFLIMKLSSVAQYSNNFFVKISYFRFSNFKRIFFCEKNFKKQNVKMDRRVSKKLMCNFDFTSSLKEDLLKKGKTSSLKLEMRSQVIHLDQTIFEVALSSLIYEIIFSYLLVNVLYFKILSQCFPFF